MPFDSLSPPNLMTTGGQWVQPMSADEISALAGTIIEEPRERTVAMVTAKVNYFLVYAKKFAPDQPAKVDWTWMGETDASWPAGTTLEILKEVVERFADQYDVRLEVNEKYSSRKEPAYDIEIAERV